MAARQHAARRRLPHQESAIGGDLDRLGDFDRIEFDERPPRAIAGVVNDDVGRELGRVEIGEQLLDLVALGSVAIERLGVGRLDELIELGGRARGQHDAHPRLGERARERGRQAGAGADDEGGSVALLAHGFNSRLNSVKAMDRMLG